MNKLFFYIPGVYSIYTRYKGIKGTIAFIFKYIMICFMGSQAYEQFFNGFYFILGMFLMFTMYEFGYIQNDAETIKYEEYPTMRLTDDDLVFYEKHKGSIYASRLFYMLLLIAISYAIGIKILIIILAVTTIPVFLIYNHIRCKWNLHIHVILMFLRYAVPVFFSCNFTNLALSCWMLAVHPLLIFMELSVKGKFGYQNKFLKKYILHVFDEKHVNTFRVKYFTVLLLGTILVAVYNIELKGFIWLSLYCWIFYVLVFLVERKKFRDN